MRKQDAVDQSPVLLVKPAERYSIAAPRGANQRNVRQLVLNSAKGTAACHQIWKESASSLGGTRGSGPVLRGFLGNYDHCSPDSTLVKRGPPGDGHQARR